MKEINFQQVIMEPLKKIKSFSQLPPEKFAGEADENSDYGLADKAALFFLQLDKKQRKERLKSTQLRKFFHALKNIEKKYKNENDVAKLRNDLALIMPELAYALGRELVPREFYELMKECLSPAKIQTVDDFRHFIKFLTALLAYHKMHNELKDFGSDQKERRND